MTGIRNRIFSSEDYNCTIPNNDVFGLHPTLPYCKDSDSANRIYYMDMEIWTEFATKPSIFGCRYLN
jgi:hypothetical protein